MKCKNIQQVRDNIDRIDDQIIKLIAERGEYVSQAAKFKKSADGVKDTARVENVIKGVREKAERFGADPDMAEALYREMISRFVKSELDDFERIKNSGSVKIKICGMRRAEDILYVNEYLPDYAGFILSPGFRRTIDRGSFTELRRMLSEKITCVGVFVDEPMENILAYGNMLDVIQLHGSENAEYIKALSEKTDREIWKAVKTACKEDIENADKLPCDKLLIDSCSEKQSGKTGKRVDLDTVKNARITKPFFMAGGINSENAGEIISAVSPYGIDLSGSVETDGYKDKEKIAEIIMKTRKKDING